MVQLVNLLLQRGADPNKSNSDGDAALHYALAEFNHATEEDIPNREAIVRALINAGADVHRPGEDNTLPLEEALCVGWPHNPEPGIVQALIDAGANINAICDDGKPLIFQALWSQKLWQLLIDNGADINARDAEGNTILHAFVSHGFVEDEVAIARRLIELGVDPNATNELGQTVLAMTKDGIGVTDELLELLEQNTYATVDQSPDTYAQLKKKPPLKNEPLRPFGSHAGVVEKSGNSEIAL